MTKKTVYRVAFLNEGKTYEIYARAVNASHLLGFVEVEGLLFGERTTVVVDPAEERLRTEFAGVERTYIPLHAVIRIDQVARRGTARITAANEAAEKVRPLFVPGKRER